MRENLTCDSIAVRPVTSILNLVPIRIRMSVHCIVVFEMLRYGSVENVYVSESYKGCCPIYPRLTVYPTYMKYETLKASHVIFNIFGLKFHESSKFGLKFHRQSSKFELKFHRHTYISWQLFEFIYGLVILTCYLVKVVYTFRFLLIIYKFKYILIYKSPPPYGFRGYP